MQRNEKQYNSFIFDMAYTQISKTTPSPYLNIALIILQYLMFLLKFYDLIDPTQQHNFSLPYLTIFLILVSLLGVFVLFTLLSYHLQWFNTLWLYLLLFLQALEMMYVEIAMRCFTGASWCSSDSKMQILVLLVTILFVAVVVLRAYCYTPFYDNLNPLAMNSGRIVLYTLAYACLTSLTTNHLLLSTSTGSKQINFCLTAVFFSLLKEPPNSSPLLSRTYFVCGVGLLWSSAVIWLMPVAQYVLGSSSGSIWFYWAYSVPIMLSLAFLHSGKFNQGYHWQRLFLDTRPPALNQLFLQVNQLIRYVGVIKRSDLGTNSAEFRGLWRLIGQHNQQCDKTDCPLNSLATLRVQREDELLQQKRLNRTIEKALEFGLYSMNSQRDAFPNLIPLSLEIANFQLEVFHLRTKGLQLFNKQWGRCRGEDQWGIYYLKRRIESFEGSGEASSGEREEAIAAFKHEIEVSVAMLAEFWYFLADPKCNLKKLYDLANVLFPLKRSVDEAWRSVRQLHSVECYHLYAKYLIRMFNDKERGLRVLEEARRLEAEAHDREEVLAGSDAASEEHGVIFLEFDGKNSGIMYQVNTACEKIFGYNKGELQGRKVNDIMPRLFAFHHDRILENYQQTNRPRMMNKERNIWGRAKNGYLFPFLICIKPVRNYFSQTSEVYASVKRDLWLKERAFFFTDDNLHLTDVSAAMLPLFPSLAGKINLKKKIHISEILPDYQVIMPRLLQQETHDLVISRSFAISQQQTFNETIPLTLQAQQMTTAVSGMIGYYFKLYRTGSGSTNENCPSNQGNSSSQGNNSSLGMDSKRQFKLVAAIREGETAKRMVYQGGLVRDAALLRSQMLSRISNSVEQEKRQRKEEEVGRQVNDYAGEIKTKRLQGTFIREIHQLSEESEINGIVGGNPHEEEEGELSEAIKPCELNSILERQTTNKPIFILKTLAVAMLALSTLLSILEYTSLFSFNSDLVASLTTYAALNSLEAQTMFLNNFANLVAINSATPADLSTLANEINLLDSLSPSIPLSISTQLVYSDLSTQTMLLRFAINKLISEAQLLASADTTPSTLFFVEYNTVNGLQISCKEAVLQLRQAISTNYSQGTIFLAITACLLLALLIVQNIVLRRVLNKKADILNIFFQIPRYSCSALQKECERFIQRLSADNEEDQLEIQALEQEEESDLAVKRQTTQKKRTIMGEEKTATTFVIVSLLMLTYFIINPLLVQSIQQSQTSATSFTFEAVSEALRLQKQLAKTISFMNTHIVQPGYSLAQQPNATAVITQQYTLIMGLLGNVSTNFFYLGSILDSIYLQNFNSIYYTNLCSNASLCFSDLGQDKGFNVILFNYYDYIISKYIQITSTNNYNLTSLYSSAVSAKQENYRTMVKTYWRRLENVLIDAVKRYLQQHDSIYFGVMVALCVINCTVLLWGWMAFYNELQKKIMASQYILTFIPIDEINKNPKIVRYIKDKILRIH